MKENEFDIQVRNLLQDATAPVSPKVWDAVAAGLPARRRIAPMWWWTAVSVAAAAALAVGIFLFRPAQTEPQQEFALVTAPAPVEQPVLLAEAAAVAPAAQPVQSVKPAPAVKLVPTIRLRQEEEPEAVMPLSEEPVVEAAVEAAPAAVPAEAPASATAAPAAEDQTLLNQLAFAEQQKASARSISLLASANMQGNTRGAVPGSIARMAQSSDPMASIMEEGIYNESPEVSFTLPFSIGVGVQYHILPRVAVGAGIRYTYLSRMFVGDYSGKGFAVRSKDIDNHQHWLGIPVNGYFSLVNQGRLRVHAFAGGAVEWLVDNEYTVHQNSSDIHYHDQGHPVQWSAGAGLGAELKLSPLVGIFLDPSIRYYFHTSDIPRSLRTIQPLRFDIEAGVRFSFGNL